MSEGTIRFTAQALQEMADVMATTLQEQILAGINQNGDRFPPGVDLIASGALVRSIRGVVVNGVPSVEVGVPYADVVNARYGFAGICPQWMAEFEKQLQPIINRGSYLDPQR